MVDIFTREVKASLKSEQRMSFCKYGLYSGVLFYGPGLPIVHLFILRIKSPIIQYNDLIRIIRY